jgi:GTP cyclohydrolase III
MEYKYIDGDNIGLKIETSFLENDELSLKDINTEVQRSVEQLTRFLIDNDQIIVFSGADGIICKGDNLNIPMTLDYMRTSNTKLTFSIGIGTDLKDCYIALRYAKSINKNIAVQYIHGQFTIIDGANTKKFTV